MRQAAHYWDRSQLLASAACGLPSCLNETAPEPSTPPLACWCRPERGEQPASARMRGRASPCARRAPCAAKPSWRYPRLGEASPFINQAVAGFIWSGDPTVLGHLEALVLRALNQRSPCAGASSLHILPASITHNWPAQLACQRSKLIADYVAGLVKGCLWHPLPIHRSPDESLAADQSVRGRSRSAFWGPSANTFPLAKIHRSAKTAV